MRRLRLTAVVFVIAASVFAVGFVGTAAAGPVDLDHDTDLNGEGVDGDPCIITNASELQAMAGNLSAHYELGKDIDASDAENWNDGDGFEPIGDNSDGFIGTFDGDGHTISHLIIDRSGEDHVGLFGGTDEDASIETVGLEDVDIHGNNDVGGLVGDNDGTVSESYATGTVTGDGNNVGGLVGLNQGTLEQSYATGTVTGDDDIGGLVGRSQGGGEKGLNARDNMSDKSNCYLY